MKKPGKKKRAAEKVVKAIYLYGNYRVDSRGPYGMLVDALKDLHPQAAEAVMDGTDLREVIDRFFPEEP